MIFNIYIYTHGKKNVSTVKFSLQQIKLLLNIMHRF